METGPKVGDAVEVKKVLAALSGSHWRRNEVRKPPAMNPVTSTPM